MVANVEFSVPLRRAPASGSAAAFSAPAACFATNAASRRISETTREYHGGTAEVRMSRRGL